MATTTATATTTTTTTSSTTTNYELRTTNCELLLLLLLLLLMLLLLLLLLLLQQQQQSHSRDVPFSSATMRFRRDGPPPHYGGIESCSLAGTCHNPTPAIPPYVVRTPHAHGAPTTEETTFE